LKLAEDIVHQSTRADDVVLGLMGLCWRTVDLYLLGHPRAAQSHAELAERAEAAGCEAVAFIADVMGAMCLARTGQFEAAEQEAAEAVERGVRAGDPDAPAYFGAMIGALRWWQGRGREVIDEIRALGTSPRLGTNDHVYVAAGAVLSAALGDTDAAEEALTRLTGGEGRPGLSDLPCSSSWLTTLFLTAEAAFVLGDGEAASQAAALVAPFASLPVMPSLAVVCFGSAQRTLGLAAALGGDLDSSVGHLERAVEADRQLGNRPMGVLTEHALSAVLKARGTDVDRARGEALAARAVGRADRMALVLPPIPGWLEPRGYRQHRAALRPVGGGWRVTVDGRDTLVAGRVGMAYLADLVGAAGQDIHVLRLIAGASQSTQGLLDEDAVKSYRSRVRDLSRIIDRGEGGEGDRVEAEAELAAINTQLRTSVGLGGKSRGFPTEQERARTSVRKALVRALDSIRATEPDFVTHLEGSITTGFTCRYDPIGGWRVVVER
jgi:hypothetical protein